jgi:hypothetical protein
MVNGVVTELKFYLAEKWLSKSKQDAKKRCRFELKQDFEMARDKIEASHVWETIARKRRKKSEN